MRNIKDFQARYDRWKNGERYWDIRGIDLPRYDTGDKNTVVTDDGSVFNVDPSRDYDQLLKFVDSRTKSLQPL